MKTSFYGLLIVAPLLGSAGASPAADAVEVELTVSQGQRLSGDPDVVRLERGDSATLSVRAAEELHPHGYELQRHLQPGQVATLKFVAQRNRRFAVELHKPGTELTALEIHPL